MSSLKPVAHRRTDALAQTHWAAVERLLAEHYRNAGYTVDHCGTGANGSKFDGGIDLKLRRDDAYIVVQCKHWNALKVPHNDVHQLLGIMVNEGATGAILVTSGEFSRAAIEAATRHGHVQLIDGDDLREMLGPLPGPPASVDSGSNSRLTYVVLTLFALATLAMVSFMVLAQFHRLVDRAAQPLPTGEPIMLQPQVVPNAGDGDVLDTSPIPMEQPDHLEPTPEEIRESQRKADEAITVIKATPEI
ncbi:restriction endonuclease [Noviluteimonas gilva]|uniref:Restriction endonuclease type IV Mrr domain-containing protein n=1 Tax=Noviluteimonas gilva TaxID=2682097 RepID=A0A7C9LLL6_9GAMM|nr:restriction endonuclease [Lysobacter gilvus]MUV14364.1 hypothetical protein [Lysobacter gilvus]